MFDGALSFVKQKLQQGLHTADDVYNDAVNGVKSVFNSPATPPATAAKSPTPSPSPTPSIKFNGFQPQNNLEFNTLPNQKPSAPIPINPLPNNPPAPASSTEKTLAKTGMGIVKGFSNLGAIPVESGRSALAQISGNKAARNAAESRLNQDVSNNIVGGTLKLAGNTLKGEIGLPAKALYQQVVEHNPTTSTQTTLKESPTSLQGFGSAAQVPAYFLNTPLAKATGQNPADTMLQNLGISKGETGLQRGIQIGGAALNSTVPLALKGLSDVGGEVGTSVKGEVGNSVKLADFNNVLDAARKGELGGTEGPSLLGRTAIAEPKPSGLPLSDEASLLKSAPFDERVNGESPRPGETMFPNRSADADRAALDVVDRGGTYKDAVEAYKQAHPAQVDQNTAELEVSRVLREGRQAPQFNPIEIPNDQSTTPGGAFTDLDKATHRLDDFYNSKLKEPTDINDLLNKASGKAQQGRRLANNYAQAIKETLTKDERVQVTDLREGDLRPEDASPIAVRVAEVEDQLAKKGLDIRKVDKPDINTVEKYSTRLPISRYRSDYEVMRDGSSSPIKVAFNKVNDLFGTESRFGSSRDIGKFVSEDGSNAKFGTAQGEGLRKTGDNTYVGKDDNLVYHREAATRREIEQSGAVKYQPDSAKIAQQYHGETVAVRARQLGLNEILHNPDKYQIHDYPMPGDKEIDVKGTNLGEGLTGKYAPKAIAKVINEKLSLPEPTNPALRVWQNARNTVTQFIVLNPRVHGMNLAWQTFRASGDIPLFESSRIPSGPLGGVKVANSLWKLMTDSGFRDEAYQRYFEDGGHTESFGKDNPTILTKAADKANLPHITKANATVMSGIETNLRVALHESNLEAGMDAGRSIKTIDTFLGSSKEVNVVAQNAGLFIKWLRTQGTSLSSSVTHPLANAGATANLVTGFALWYGATKAWQAFSGNPNATVQAPGDLGLVVSASRSPREVQQGKVPSIVTNHVNPLLIAPANQAYGKDIRTGQTLSTPGQRGTNIAKTLFAPSTPITKVAGGKQSVAEQVLNIATGATLPHVKGAPAAPNLPIFNTPGAKPALGTDPTGIQQANAFYDALGKEQRGLAGDNNKQTLSTVNDYFNRNRDDTGRTIQEAPATRIANAKSLFGDDAARAAVQRIQQAQALHDPMWDLPDDKLKTFLDYQSQYTADPERSRMEQQSPWLKDFVGQRAQWYQQQNIQGNSVPDSFDAQNPYPTAPPQVSTVLDQLSNTTDSTQRADLLSKPGVTDWLNQEATWANKVRVKEGGIPLQPFPTESEHVKAVLDSMPQGTDPASKKARALLINGNPDVNQYLADVALHDVTKNLAGYYLQINPNVTEGQELNQGDRVAQQTLKGISSLGAYDIGKNPTTGAYSFLGAGGPGQLGQGFSIAGGGGSGGSKKKPLVPAPRRVKVHKLKVKKAPRQRNNRAKLAKLQSKTSPPKSRPLHPVGFNRTQVIKV